MLKTTSQDLINSMGHQGGTVGRPMTIGAALDQDPGSAILYTVPKGQVFLVTHIVAQIDVSSQLAGAVASPQSPSLFGGLATFDEAGTGQDTIEFKAFARWNNLFLTGGSPTWKTSFPANTVQWGLKYPYPVFAGWTVRSSATPGGGSGWGNHYAVYGVQMDENAARMLGFQVRGSATDSERRMGAVSLASPSTPAALVAGRTGQSIRILDLSIRIQPETNTANTVTLSETADGTRNIFQFRNDNPAEFFNYQFSPDIYLTPGAALDLGSTVANTASVTCVYEYVDAADVPSDHFWACVDPDLPTPGAGTTGTGSVLTSTSTEITLYYPGRAGRSYTDTTKTSPGKGYQHILNGYAVSVQKNAEAGTAETDATEQTKLCLSTGSAAGQIQSDGYGTTQTNYQLSPVFSASSHDQSLGIVVPGINVPCKKDDGSIWVDTLGFNGIATTPTQTANDIAGWAVTVWGRTTNEQFTDPANKGA